MKRTLTFALALALSFCLAACDDDSKNNNSGSGDSSSIKEGDACTGTEDDVCVNGSVAYCSKDSTTNTYAYVVYPCDSGTACSVKDDYAECFDVCSASDVSKSKSVCENGLFGSYITKMTCEKDENGVYAYRYSDDDVESCVNGCASSGDKCADLLVSDQGETCKVASRPDRCDNGDIVSTCDDSFADYGDEYITVEAYSCKEEYGSGYSCIMVDSEAGCYSARDKCDKVGDKKSECGSSSYYGTVVYDYECKTAADGNNYWVYVDGDYCDDGNGYCDASGACHAAETCSDSDKETCVDNFITYCDDSSVATLDCKSYTEYYGEEYSCKAIGGVYDCFSASDECSSVGATSSVCDDSYGDDAEVVYTCKKTDDGKLVNVMTDGNYCKNSCASDGKTCDSEGYDE